MDCKLRASAKTAPTTKYPLTDTDFVQIFVSRGQMFTSKVCHDMLMTGMLFSPVVTLLS